VRPIGLPNTSLHAAPLNPKPKPAGPGVSSPRVALRALLEEGGPSPAPRWTEPPVLRYSSQLYPPLSPLNSTM